MSESTGSWVETLPPELVLHIFSFLEALDVCYVSAICRSWRRFVVTWEETVWRQVSEATFGGPNDGRNWRSVCMENHKKYEESVGILSKPHHLRTDPERMRLDAFVNWSVEAGHHRLVRQLLRDKIITGVSVTALGQRPLVWLAVSSKRLETARVLLAHGAPADARVPMPGMRATLLGAAVGSGQMPLVQVIYDALIATLVERGASAADAHKQAIALLPLDDCLCAACGQGAVAVARWLLSLGAAVNPVKGKGKPKDSPLLWACSRNCEELIALLLENGALLDPDWGRTPLAAATEKNNINLMQRLLAAGARACGPRRNKQQETAVFDAVDDPSRTDALQVLLRADKEAAHAVTDEKNGPAGDLPIHRAARRHNLRAVDVLLRHSQTLLWRKNASQHMAVTVFCESQPTKVSPADSIALLEFFCERHGEEELTAVRAVPTQSSRLEQTLLGILLARPWSPLCEYALKSTCLRQLVNTPVDGYRLRETLLHAAVRQRELPRVTCLLEAGASLMLAFGGESPLHLHVGANPLMRGVVDALIEAGDSWEARDVNGMTPLMHLAHLGDIGAALGYGADPHAVDANGWNVAHHLLVRAAKAGNRWQQYFEFVRDHCREDVLARTNAGETVLHLLPHADAPKPSSRYYSVVVLFVSMGVDPLAVDAHGRKASDLAAAARNRPRRAGQELNVDQQYWATIEAGRELREWDVPVMTLDGPWDQ